MVSSLYAPSRRRSAALWRAFQRPFPLRAAVAVRIAAPARPFIRTLSISPHPTSTAPER
ncbi:MAG: hypothetical protein WB974_02695 [Acidobacteriaceae bacterium]